MLWLLPRPAVDALMKELFVSLVAPAGAAVSDAATGVATLLAVSHRRRTHCRMRRSSSSGRSDGMDGNCPEAIDGNDAGATRPRPETL